MMNCPECDGELVVVEGTGQQADFAPCPRCAVAGRVPDVVVEQGPNTNGDVFPKITEKMLPPVYSTHAAKDEQILAVLGVRREDLEKYGPSTVTRADRAQRIQDLTDLSFRPAYVMSTLDPKSIAAAALNFRPKEEIGDAVVNVPAVARVRFGWDANGSPVEEWP